MHSWYSFQEFLSLRHHVNWFGGQYSTAETIARVRDFYGITGTPTVIMSGELRYEGASVETATGEPYRAGYLSLKGPSPFAMEIRNFDPVAGSFEIFIEVVSDPGPLGGNMMVRSVVYEDGLIDNTGAEQNQVTRDLMPDQPLTATAVGETQTIPVAYSPDPGWVTANMQALAFIQEDNPPCGNNICRVWQAISSVPPPNFGLNYYAGETRVITPPAQQVAMEDVVLFNIGNSTDTFHVDVVSNQAPGDWTALVSDGTNSDPSGLTVSLAPGESQAFHLEINPASIGYGGYAMQLWQDGDPTNIRNVDFVVLTEQLPILLVDDDGGAAYEQYYTVALDDGGYLYGVWPRSAGPLTAQQLSSFRVVVWNVGWGFPSLTAEDRTALESYLAGGGRLFISGQDIGWEMCDSTGPYGPGSPECTWYETNLHALYVTDDTNLLSITGVGGDPVGDGLLFNIRNVAGGDDGADNQQYPSEIRRNGAGAESSMIYTGGNRVAAVRADTGSYRMVYFAFGFEAIDNRANRALTMQQVIDWLDPGAPGCNPARITSFRAVKTWPDIEFSWQTEPTVDDGYNIYETDDPTVLPNLRGDGGCGDCTPIISDPGTTVTYTDGATSGRMYYQILGSCASGAEGPN